MKNSFKPLFVIFVVAVVLSMIIQPHGSTKGIVPWRKDLAAARQEAKLADKPVFVEFSAGWCGPCQDMARTTWSDKSVAAELGKMVPVQIDIDTQPQVASDYGISPIPAYLILDTTGTVVKSGAGYLPPEKFIEWLHGKGDVH